ncbi:MAG: peroxiredoxin [Hyphomicrobiales bacterium]
MTIQPGEKIPDTILMCMTDEGPQPMKAHDIFGGRKAVLFAVPGAFTPTCHNQHVPGYLAHMKDFEAKGVDLIACVTVNDVFVVDAWARQLNAKDKIMFLGDGNGDFAKAVGLDQDFTPFSMGVRSQRYAMILDDCTLKALHIEEAAAQAVQSGAEAMLAEL